MDLQTGRVHAVFLMRSVPVLGKILVISGFMEAADPGRGRDGRWLFHHTLLHFPFFSLRWNFLRRLVQTSLH